jgi:hypothetical protein
MMLASDSCTQLPATGSAYSVVAVILVAIACFAFGLALLRASRRGDRSPASIALLLVLAVCLVAVSAPSSSATAAPPGCGDATSSISVTQTSIITGLAPGKPADAVEAIGTNIGDSSVFVQKVVARISSVTKAPLAVAGACDAMDYIVETAQMPVNQTVPPAGSVEIGGATIAFNDRSTNQDACKGATVHLGYDVYQS